MDSNPFWSERVREDAAVSAMRPDALPSPPDTEEAMPLTNAPGQVSHGIGKGRGGGGPTGAGRGFETPEAKRDLGSPGNRQPHDRRPGFQTQGVMSAGTGDDDYVAPRAPLRTMGPMKSDTQNTSVETNNMTGSKSSDDDQRDGLQRAVEQQMYDDLVAQNRRLQQELADLREREQRGSTRSVSAAGTSDSWENVDGPRRMTVTHAGSGGVATVCFYKH